MNSVQVGSKFVSEASPTYMIAEIGINHNGDLEIAKKLIDEAVKSGFDAVKFQKRTVKVVFTEEELNRHRESVFGTTNGDLKYGLEFDHNDFAEIDKHCKKSGIDWFASPWDNESLKFLEKFNVVAHKVASACLTDKELLSGLKATKKPVFLSTGMSSLDQIKTAVALLDPEKTILMHAISVYPAKQEQLHLSWIADLKNNFPGIPVGYSGHEAGVMPSVIAVAKFGAVCVERHITLDRSMWGSDQSASLEPEGMERVVKYIRSIPKVSGTGNKHVLSEEVPILEKLRRVKDF
jgi:N-acetylneuraminate synthase